MDSVYANHNLKNKYFNLSKTNFELHRLWLETENDRLQKEKIKNKEIVANGYIKEDLVPKYASKEWSWTEWIPNAKK